MIDWKLFSAICFGAQLVWLINDLSPSGLAKWPVWIDALMLAVFALGILTPLSQPPKEGE